MKQAGGMKLDELHVRDRHARAVGHGHAVAGGDVGVRGVEIDLAAAAGGQQHMRAATVSTGRSALSST
jgi:hypothetical protein